MSDVLDFARPIRFMVQRADLVQICRDAAQAARAEDDRVDIVLEAASPEAPIQTDPERMRGVLVNLLSNAGHAVRASGADGSPSGPAAVRLRVAPVDGGWWRIEVVDQGAGIPAEDLSRVFEPFFTTRRTGSGLGLALARNIVEGLGGSIVVDSQVDRGTTVRIDLPDRPPAAEN